jgi:hypothetical protein
MFVITLYGWDDPERKEKEVQWSYKTHFSPLSLSDVLSLPVFVK